MTLRLVVLLLLFQMGAAAQRTPVDFVLDNSNPYVYLKLDHVGPRKPMVAGESALGVWVRLVNNCRIPIVVQTIGTDVDGITVLDQVEKYSQGVTISSTDSDGNPDPVAKHAEPPNGYDRFSSDIPGYTKILPGSNLLFSVPINHVVGDGWYMRVRFSFDLPHSRSGPYSYVDSFTIHVPPQYLQNKAAAR
jgi:hypothetical protein